MIALLKNSVKLTRWYGKKSI